MQKVFTSRKRWTLVENKTDAYPALATGPTFLEPSWMNSNRCITNMNVNINAHFDGVGYVLSFRLIYGYR